MCFQFSIHATKKRINSQTLFQGALVEKKFIPWYNRGIYSFAMSFFHIIPVAFAQTAAQNVRDESTTGVQDMLAGIASAFPYWIAAILVFVLSFFLARFVKKLVVYRVTSRSRYDVHQEMIILIDRAVYVGVLFLGLLISFRIIGINIASILGFLGLGLGFAFKDLLANFIAGVVILTQKKFMIGDTIEVNSIFGKIIEIESRTTQIQGFDGTIHIVPNSDMLTSVVRNTTKNSFRRISFAVGIHYSTPLREAIELTLKTVEAHPDVVVKPKTNVLVTEFGDSAITLEVRFWIESTSPWPIIQSEVMQALKLAYDKAGIEIPFPIRTLTLDSFDKNLFKALNLGTNTPAYSGQSLQQNTPTQPENVYKQHIPSPDTPIQ